MPDPVRSCIDGTGRQAIYDQVLHGARPSLEDALIAGVGIGHRFAPLLQQMTDVLYTPPRLSALGRMPRMHVYLQGFAPCTTVDIRNEISVCAYGTGVLCGIGRILLHMSQALPGARPCMIHWTQRWSTFAGRAKTCRMKSRRLPGPERAVDRFSRACLVVACDKQMISPCSTILDSGEYPKRLWNLPSLCPGQASISLSLQRLGLCWAKRIHRNSPVSITLFIHLPA